LSTVSFKLGKHFLCVVIIITLVVSFNRGIDPARLQHLELFLELVDLVDRV
jgi:hypothetical protein